MTEIGKDVFGDSILELDLQAVRSGQTAKLMPASKRLVNVYNELSS